MKSHYKLVVFLSLVTVVFLAGCTGVNEPTQVSPPTLFPTVILPASTIVPPTPEYTPEVVQNDLTRTDEQGGKVIVSVTPLNLDQQTETINFDVSLETHSVDLSMDLALLSTLTTDTGKSVTPTIWDAPIGGHHVAGTLSFPSLINGTSVLEGAKTLTLTIKDVAVPERIFIWELTGTN